MALLSLNIIHHILGDVAERGNGARLCKVSHYGQAKVVTLLRQLQVVKKAYLGNWDENRKELIPNVSPVDDAVIECAFLGGRNHWQFCCWSMVQAWAHSKEAGIKYFAAHEGIIKTYALMLSSYFSLPYTWYHFHNVFRAGLDPLTWRCIVNLTRERIWPEVLGSGPSDLFSNVVLQPWSHTPKCLEDALPALLQKPACGEFSWLKMVPLNSICIFGSYFLDALIFYIIPDELLSVAWAHVSLHVCLVGHTCARRSPGRVVRSKSIRCRSCQIFRGVGLLSYGSLNYFSLPHMYSFVGIKIWFLSDCGECI